MRRRARALAVIAVLLGAVVITIRLRWVEWLTRHPGQAWQWVTDHWRASSAMAVFVALLGAWVTWATPRWQQHRAEAREDAKQARVEAEAASERQALWEARCRSMLVRWPLSAIQEADPYQLGVFYSRRAEAHRADRERPPYVRRAVDGNLARLLRSQPLVLIKGQSRAGKSRTADEVAARELAGWRLLVPKDRTALAAPAELDPLPGQGEPVLVWLDDLDEY